MFQIREDVYRRREMADKLKIAFATAASAGLGVAIACSAAGAAGPLLYAGTAAAWIAFSVVYSKLGMDKEGQSPLLPDQIPFRDIAPAVREIAQKAGIEPPPVFQATFEEGASRAHTNGESVFFDSKFIKEGAAEDIVAVLAHEIAHIKNGGVKTSRGIEIPLSLANIFVPLTTLIHGMSADSPRQALFSLLFLLTTRKILKISDIFSNFASRAEERRADRLAARWTKCPLDLAVALEKSAAPATETEPKKYSQRWLSEATHPDTADRIRDIATLCKRVPDAAPSGQIQPSGPG